MHDLELTEPAQRYEYDAPGGLIDLDTRKFGRFEVVGYRITEDRTGQSHRPVAPQSSRRGTEAGGSGWEHIHVCIDDHSRLSFTRMNERIGTDAYRLPTEAEWEYAARAGTVSRFPTGDTMTAL